MAMQRTLSCEYMDYIAHLELTATDYKVLLLLICNKATQAQIARALNKQSQNINRSIANLKSLGLIEVESLDGRNKYYKAVKNMSALKNNASDTASDALSDA